MKIYLDDERVTPDGWHRTYTVRDTIALLETRTVIELSLDNDLGNNKPQGFTVLDWLEQMVYDDSTFPIPIVTIHSANPVRVKHMQRTMEAIYIIRQQQIGGG